MASRAFPAKLSPAQPAPDGKVWEQKLREPMTASGVVPIAGRAAGLGGDGVGSQSPDVQNPRLRIRSSPPKKRERKSSTDGSVQPTLLF